MVLYVFLYNPIFNAIGIGSVKLSLIAALGYSFFNKRVVHFLSFFRYELIFVLLLVVYAFINSIRSDLGLLSQSYLFIVWFLESIYLPVVIVIVFRLQLERVEWHKWILITGIIAATISVILIFNPSLNDYIRYSLLQSSGSEFDEYHFIRGFGFADGLRGVYPLTQAMILGICFFYLRSSFLYALPILLIIISIAFNARTGLLAIPVILFLLLIQFKLGFRVIVVFGGLVFLVINIAIFFPSFISNNEQTIDWLYSGFSEVVGKFQGESGGASETLLKEDKFVPKDIFSVLFGTGNLGPTVGRVDNGYYYMLWFGGWLLMLMLLLFTLFMFGRVVRIENDKYFTYLFFLLLLIFTVKWNYLFNPSGISRLMGLYYVIKILMSKGYINSGKMNKDLIISPSLG